MVWPCKYKQNASESCWSESEEDRGQDKLILSTIFVEIVWEFVEALSSECGWIEKCGSLILSSCPRNLWGRADEAVVVVVQYHASVLLAVTTSFENSIQTCLFINITRLLISGVKKRKFFFYRLLKSFFFFGNEYFLSSFFLRLLFLLKRC